MLRTWLLPALVFAYGHAEWTQTNGPYGGHVLELASGGSTLFAAIPDSGMLRSKDNGDSWAWVKVGPAQDTVRLFAINGPSLIVGTWGCDIPFPGPGRFVDPGR
jgi:hypothetical protein